VSAAPGAQVIAYRGEAPDIAPDAWVAPGATVVGAARLRARSSVWYGAVIRAGRPNQRRGSSATSAPAQSLAE